MMDIRRCSKEEIDEINERMKRWKQRQETKQELPILGNPKVSSTLGDIDGMPAGKEGRVMRVRGDMLPDRMPIGAPPGVCVSPVLGSAAGAQMEAIEKERGDIMQRSFSRQERL